MLIYKITNLVNGKVYIGQTKNTLQKRWTKHRDDSKKNKKYLYQSIRKHGIENFKMEKIDFAESQAEMDSKEKYWIAKYQSNKHGIGFNLTDGGQNGTAFNEMAKTNRIINLKQRKRKFKNPYICVYLIKKHNLWAYTIIYKGMDIIKTHFKSAKDAAIARDIKLIELFNFEEIEFHLNFPENKYKYLNKQIKEPQKILSISPKRSRFYFVNWNKPQKRWRIRIKFGKEEFTKGHYKNEDDAALVADYFNLKLLNDLKRINFPERIIELQNLTEPPAKTMEQTDKTTNYKYIIFYPKKNNFEVAKRRSNIRKKGFKTIEEAKQYRDIELTKLNIPIPD